jgi:glycosyltransferase involved in cell wall biosynthesis
VRAHVVVSSDRPLRVIYDITVLSNGIRFEPSRTGIYRVIERTAKGLSAHRGIHLKLSAAESWENYYWSGRYLRMTPELSKIARTPNNLLAKSLDAAQRFLYGDSGSIRPNRSPIARRLIGAVANRTSPLPSRAVARADIFHSGFYALPKTTIDVRGLRRFITIYDLIPLRFPELFATGLAVQVRELFLAALKSIRQSDFVFAISQCTKDDLCTHAKLDPARVFVTPLAAAKEQFYPCKDSALVDGVREKYGIPSHSRYLLSVNTLEPRKNMERAVRCFAEMIQASRIDDLYYVLVGTRGWGYEHILSTIADCNLAVNKVILAGYVSDNELAPLYSGATAFVYPSKYEGFGLPPLEAMQCGTPVITSNTSSLPEVVGESGMLVDPDDGDALSAAMLAMYRNQAIRESYAQRALKRAQEFSWDHYTDAVVDGYESSIGG